MTKRLEQAFAEASKLSLPEQNALADWLLAELEAERGWGQLFADSQEVLSELAAEARAEHRSMTSCLTGFNLLPQTKPT